jgi:RNA polymerase sigma-70 factor (ECF subfamily)
MRAYSSPRFQTTSWSIVLEAGGNWTEHSEKALCALCEIYWKPVYAFIRRSGYNHDDAQDLTQGFFALLVEKSFLKIADPQRGRFRSFLLTAVKRFLANEIDRNRALKRGGGQAHIPISIPDGEEWYASAIAEAVTPETLFERRWALALMNRAMMNLRDEFTAAGKSGQFDSLTPFLNRETDGQRYETLAAEWNMSAGALRIMVHRMRRRYRELLRDEIAETVASLDEVDDEIRFLLSVLSS